MIRITLIVILLCGGLAVQAQLPMNIYRAAAMMQQMQVQSGTQPTPVDLLIVPNGTPGELMSLEDLNVLGEVGELLYDASSVPATNLQHTFAETVDLPIAPLSVNGTVVSNLTQLMHWNFGVTNTIDPNTNRYEGYIWKKAGLTNATNVTTSVLVKFSTNSGSGYQNFDFPKVQTLGHTNYGYSVTQWQGDTESGTNHLLRLTSHGAGNIIARPERWYYANNRFTSLGDTNVRAEQLLIDHETGEFVGYAVSKSDFEGTGTPYLYTVTIRDYLRIRGINGGGIKKGYTAVDRSNGKFPLQPFWMPAVKNLSTSQGLGTITVTWTALSGTTNILTRSVNGGAATVLTNVYVDLTEDTFTDSDVSLGNVYSYSVTQAQAGQTSAPAVVEHDYALASYVAAWDFEATNAPPEATVVSPTITFGYTNSPAPIHGAGSMFVSSYGNVRLTVADANEMEVYFKVRFITPPTSESSVFGFYNSGGTELTVFKLNSSFQALLGAGGSNTSPSAGTFNTNDVFDVWLRLVDGGTSSLAFSTNGVRPTSGDNFLSKTAASGVTVATFRAISGTGSSRIADKVRVSVNGLSVYPIGDNPE